MWLEATEEKFDGKDENIADQINNYQPKVEQLGDMASQLLDKYANNKDDIEPEMQELGHRWQSILVKIHNTTNKYTQGINATNVVHSDLLETLPEEPESFGEKEIPEMEEIAKKEVIENSRPRKISECSDKPPICQSDALTTSATSDPEEISTLPEDSYRSAAYNVTNSRGSSPECITIDHSSPFERKNKGKESSPSKIPRKIAPSTKPKPQWYIDSVQTVPAETRPVVPIDVTFVQKPSPAKPSSIPLKMQDGVNMPILPKPGSVASPVKQVTVSITSLPIQMPVSSVMEPAVNTMGCTVNTVACTVVQPEVNMVVACSSPVSTVLPSVDTSPTLSPVDNHEQVCTFHFILFWGCFKIYNKNSP